MEAIANFFQTHFPYIVNHLYLVLFIGGLIEGMNAFLIGGFLASFGQVRLLTILPVLFLAHIINGYMWYFVGYFGGSKALDKWGYKNRISQNIIEKVSYYFDRYSGRAIILSKFTYSLEIATLVLAGSLKYNLKEFSKYNAVGSFGWVSATFFIGYFFGHSYQFLFSVIKNFFLDLLFLIIAILVLYLLGIYFKNVYIKISSKSYRYKDLRDRMDALLNKINFDE